MDKYKRYNENEKEFMLPNWFKGLFRLKLDKEPDFMVYHNDKPYLTRWWIIPRNRFFNIWIHKIEQSDDDRALHDHPWHNFTFVLKGGYKEVTLVYSKNLIKGYGDYWSFFDAEKITKERKKFGFAFRNAREPHQLIIDKPAITLFITGPVIRDWGFHDDNQWVYWEDYKAQRDTPKEEEKEPTTVPNTVNRDKLDFEF